MSFGKYLVTAAIAGSVIAGVTEGSSNGEATSASHLELHLQNEGEGGSSSATAQELPTPPEYLDALDDFLTVSDLLALQLAEQIWNSNGPSDEELMQMMFDIANANLSFKVFIPDLDTVAYITEVGNYDTVGLEQTVVLDGRKARVYVGVDFSQNRLGTWYEYETETGQIDSAFTSIDPYGRSVGSYAQATTVSQLDLQIIGFLSTTLQTEALEMYEEEVYVDTFGNAVKTQNNRLDELVMTTNLYLNIDLLQLKQRTESVLQGAGYDSYYVNYDQQGAVTILGEMDYSEAPLEFPRQAQFDFAADGSIAAMHLVDTEQGNALPILITKQSVAVLSSLENQSVQYEVQLLIGGTPATMRSYIVNNIPSYNFIIDGISYEGDLASYFSETLHYAGYRFNEGMYLVKHPTETQIFGLPINAPVTPEVRSYRNPESNRITSFAFFRPVKGVVDYLAYMAHIDNLPTPQLAVAQELSTHGINTFVIPPTPQFYKSYSRLFPRDGGLPPEPLPDEESRQYYLEMTDVKISNYAPPSIRRDVTFADIAVVDFTPDSLGLLVQDLNSYNTEDAADMALWLQRIFEAEDLSQRRLHLPGTFYMFLIDNSDMYPDLYERIFVDNTYFKISFVDSMYEGSTVLNEEQKEQLFETALSYTSGRLSKDTDYDPATGLRKASLMAGAEYLIWRLVGQYHFYGPEENNIVGLNDQAMYTLDRYFNDTESVFYHASTIPLYYGESTDQRMWVPFPEINGGLALLVEDPITKELITVTSVAGDALMTDMNESIYNYFVELYPDEPRETILSTRIVINDFNIEGLTYVSKENGAMNIIGIVGNRVEAGGGRYKQLQEDQPILTHIQALPPVEQ